ncbi:MAG: Acetyl-coenzyme A carboxylase carboxyl transferase subunit alpha [Candidatus Moanabacter tarae]|uniref:Acetyl-coenzyme A carboxylase carboxyl transferase subunit alpha n=1 Tax=Candidatus Moanibacter tarae TaxID=2200854 RepID=A0A2Z4AIC1_9BACT|nr:MAG: Acetyl-coenzyme A carboxylase carboxyl transferase subunit alpha [Candidatus Moanabacter tarae]|tara:strand:- start:91063 stop:92097 length:1035 start_codon:yes stop_codon:yes gene_type:complete
MEQERSQFLLDFEKPIRELEEKLEELRQSSRINQLDLAKEVAAIESKIATTECEIYDNLTAWQQVQIARHPNRPYSLDYIDALFEDFQELHGDRRFGDDQALIGGTAFFEGKSIMIVAQQKGRNTKENLQRNFGMPKAEGYRKAFRLMETAAKFSMPIITFIDTPGAYPGIDSEERHVAEAIAVNQRMMSALNVPIVTIIIGEGGSGGALGIGVADSILIFENAYFSVISPEGCAAILWRDRAQKPKAAEALQLTAKDLMRFGIANMVIEEPFGGAHRDHHKAASNLKIALSSQLAELRKLSKKNLKARRYQKYRAIGVFEEPGIEEKTSSFPNPPPAAASDAS